MEYEKNSMQNNGDLHFDKQSHMSTSVYDNVEFHIRNDELQCIPEVGQEYTVEFHVICTSAGHDMFRFMADGKPVVHPWDKEEMMEAMTYALHKSADYKKMHKGG